MPPSPKGVVTDWVGFAKESGGLTTAAAAPAPSRRAKSRREIEIVFIAVTDRTISHLTRDRIADYRVGHASRVLVGKPGRRFASVTAASRRNNLRLDFIT